MEYSIVWQLDWYDYYYYYYYFPPRRPAFFAMHSESTVPVQYIANYDIMALLWLYSRYSSIQWAAGESSFEGYWVHRIQAKNRGMLQICRHPSLGTQTSLVLQSVSKQCNNHSWVLSEYSGCAEAWSVPHKYWCIHRTGQQYKIIAKAAQVLNDLTRFGSLRTPSIMNCAVHTRLRRVNRCLLRYLRAFSAPAARKSYLFLST